MSFTNEIHGLDRPQAKPAVPRRSHLRIKAPAALPQKCPESSLMMARASARWLAEATGNRELATRIGGHKWPVERAHAEGLNNSGGFLVPAYMANLILAFRDLAAVFRRNASTYSMGSDEISVPRRSGAMTASYVVENAVLPESNAVWDNVTFNAKKLALFGRLSNELNEDSAIDVAAYFLADAGNAIAVKEDSDGFNGTGTSASAGIRGVTTILLDGLHDAGKVAAASSHSTFLTLDSTDIANLMAALPERYWGNAKFYVSGFGAAAAFVRLGAAGGGLGTSRRNLNYAGIPIELTARLPGSGSQTGAFMVLFGDLGSAAAVASRRELSFMTSTHRYIDLDQTAWRLTSRWDAVVHNLGDNVNAGAVVGLVGTS